MFQPTVIAVMAAATLLLAACGGSSNNNSSTGSGSGGSSGQSEAHKAIDINPQPRDSVKDGGTLRWAVDQYSTQWNYNQLNGPEASTLDVLTALMPQPMVADEKAKWSDGSPITWKDYETQWKALSGKDPKYEIASSTGYDRVKSITRGAN